MNVFLSQKIENSITKIPIFLLLGFEFEITVIVTCNVDFSVQPHYLGCQRDVINAKNILEILSYLFQNPFFKRLQNFIKYKTEGNENKIMLLKFNCTKEKMDRYGRNKTQTLYRSCFYYALNAVNGLRINGKEISQICLS